ncbi:maleylpyruvate isomerase family mycothiol-dependent enzyme [Streptomyces sp. YIM 98790]|uniref:maleylpyruvate isomerase family mycothiol-dependent enzyme n=1 Tax=Streptomyces sp. YIM 98790 TaxID=2689077 RepID=UPI00140E3A31|nr:maleylpyruvate isomerase family mycothiol-dependent enzyme [Streptomyces sp. YIM 98790]
MTRPVTDLAGVAAATARLLSDAAALPPGAVGEPSLLPGWTRGHVLAHLSRNADALVNVLSGRPMYPSARAREADIEAGAPRPPDVHLADLRQSAARLAAAWDRLTDEEWAATVELRGGVTDRASSVPFRRWVEVELHHIDLGIGRTVGDLPGAFTDRAVDYLTRRFAGHPQVPALELRAEDGRRWRTGGPGGEPLVVAGTPAALTGWLAGRTTGTGLTAGSASGAALPVLPPL